MMGYMRRALLTVLTALALAFGGFANVAASAMCPMQTEGRAAPAQGHDCCPDDMRPPAQGDHSSKKTMDCPLMQFCRAAPSVAPENPGLNAPLRVSLTERIPAAESKIAFAAPEGVFRPPRAI
jgi:hypothetical protein